MESGQGQKQPKSRWFMEEGSCAIDLSRIVYCWWVPDGTFLVVQLEGPARLRLPRETGLSLIKALRIEEGRG